MYGKYRYVLFIQEKKVELKVEERNRQLQALVNGVTSENLDLKSRVAKVELGNTSLQGRIRKAEEKLEELRSWLVKGEIEKWFGTLIKASS
jgi:uncharacterized protein (DUF3084 family)